ncbi:hypothetical protein ACFQ61_34710 [Streptomyces sp. NPDC056500]|uniref:hypothetical protein n=1 Tax=Streptomyces sp. NPDC056500 TaxID=3345840 RepID=UPI0036940BB8
MLAHTRLSRIGLAVSTAVVLTLGLSPNAQAATGTIRYFDVNSQEFRISNPPDNVCITLQARASSITNETNKTVRLYRNGGCDIFVLDLAPGSTRSHIGGPLSVRVIG